MIYGNWGQRDRGRVSPNMARGGLGRPFLDLEFNELVMQLPLLQGIFLSQKPAFYVSVRVIKKANFSVTNLYPLKK